MKIAIMQPTFNPWLGYFDLIDNVDKFIFLDTVQINKQSWQTRNKLKVQDKELLFSIPIKSPRVKFETLIKDVFIDFRKFDFRKKLFRTLEQNYKKAKYFAEVNEFIKEIIFFETEYLSQYNINIIKQISERLNFNTQIYSLSETSFNVYASKGGLILEICKYYKTTNYISPLGSKDYLDNDIEKFNKHNIDIYYQHYTHPQYNQLGDLFIPYIGIFDLLYNEGFENSKKIILSGRNYKKAIL